LFFFEQNGTDEAETSPLQSEIFLHKKTENSQLRYTLLSSREMYWLSRCIPDKWDTLAGLMNITRADRNNIRHDNRYIDNRSRAEKILSIINHRKDFSRTKLADCLEEMQQLDLIRPVTTGEWRSLPCPAIVEQEKCIPMLTLMERRRKSEIFFYIKNF
jgi:predicted lipoprotein